MKKKKKPIRTDRSGERASAEREKVSKSELWKAQSAIDIVCDYAQASTPWFLG